MPKKKMAIGIDLGTTKCCVGVVCDGKVEIIENERSNKTTPSCVAFTDTERLVGEDARDQTTLNSANTVFGVKKLLGQSFQSPEVQRYVPDSLPFLVSQDTIGNPEIRVMYKKEEIHLRPEQVTAMLLVKMKELVETRFDCVVDEAVISVPASFTNAQRQATRDAAIIAGLKVLALINETTAAAIAYQANRTRGDKETIAIVDFGGGKLDVSVVSVKKDCVEVEATFGSSLIGGMDIDDHLVRILISKFKLAHDIDLSSNFKAIARLRCSCVSVKHTLSLLPEAKVHLDSLDTDKDLDVIITRKEFEHVVGKRLRKVCTKVVQRVLSDALVEGFSVKKCVLVGGTTRIPLVQKILRENFSRLDKSVNPDEAVAQGAALMTKFNKARVHDVTLHAFYMDTGSERQPIFDKFTNIPDSRTVVLPVKRGCRVSLVEWQYKIGRSWENVLAPNLFGFPSQKNIKFDFSIDQCGIFQATARTGNNFVINLLSLISQGSMKKMINCERSFKFDSISEQYRVSALSELESYYFSKKSYMETQHRERKVSNTTFDSISRGLNDIITWIDSSPNATKQEYEDKKLYLEKLCRTNLSKRDRTTPDNENKFTPRTLRSQAGKETSQSDVCVSGQGNGTSSTSSNQRMEEKMETGFMPENKVKPDISEIELIEHNEDGSGAPHVGGCRAKRARIEVEDHQPRQENGISHESAWGTSKENQLLSIDRKHSRLSDHDTRFYDWSTRSSFRDHPIDNCESKKRRENSLTSTSEKIRICTQILDSALVGIQQELEQQNGIQFDVFVKEKTRLMNPTFIDSELEVDVDNLVDGFADDIRNRIKNVILGPDEKNTNSQNEDSVMLRKDRLKH